MRWGALIAGLLIALGVDIGLGLVGFGLGLGSTATRGLVAAATLWWALTPLVATFVGAMVAVRIAGAVHPAAAQLHGVLLWSLALIAGAIVVTGVMPTGTPSMMTGGRAAVGSGAAALGVIFGLAGAIAGAVAGCRALTVGLGETAEADVAARAVGAGELGRSELERPPRDLHH